MQSYNVEDLINQDEKELRREYTRLRDIAQKRLKRLRNEGFGKTDVASYFGGDVPKLSSLKSKEDIVFGLAELAGFVSVPLSTVKGMREHIKEERKKAIQTDEKMGEILAKLNKHFPEGERFTRNNVDRFFDFMNTKVAMNVEKIVASDRIAKLYKVLESKRITNYSALMRSEKDLVFFINNLENLEAVELPKGTKGTVANWRRLINEEIEHGRDRSELYKKQYYESEADYARKRERAERNRKQREARKGTGKRKRGKK